MNALTGLLSQPLAIAGEHLRLLDQSILAGRISGRLVARSSASGTTNVALSGGDLVESLPYTVEAGIAVVPLLGLLTKRQGAFGSSYERFTRAVDAAVADSSVSGILLEGDTPGGTLDGVQMAAAAVRAARLKKPVFALADGLLSGAGLWIGVQAQKIFAVNESTTVGGITVRFTHTDQSKALTNAGIRRTEIVAGKFKRATSENEPLSDKGRQVLEDKASYLSSLFVAAVAEGRGVPIKSAEDRMAGDRLFFGRQAIAAGLIDGVESRAHVLDRLRAAKAVPLPLLPGTRSTGSPPAAAIRRPVTTPPSAKPRPRSQLELLDEAKALAAEIRVEQQRLAAEGRPASPTAALFELTHKQLSRP